MKGMLLTWSRPVRVGGWLLACGLGVLLAQASLKRNTEMACDLGQWPRLTSCPRPDEDVKAQVARLRERAGHNPGDASNVLALALLTRRDGGVAPLESQAVLQQAQRLAGPSPLLQQVLVAQALDARDWPVVVARLVRLAQSNRDAAAMRTLASLLGVPAAAPHVVAALRADSTWLDGVLQALGPEKVRAREAMPLLIKALSLKLLSPDAGLKFVSQLKADGDWLDAQALWLRLLGQPIGLIYNGDFERGFLRGGFDWELPNAPASRAGVEILQPQLGHDRGRVLELDFNARPLLQPLVAQTLVLFPGSYRFEARAMTLKLRAGDGLTWVFVCMANGAPIAQTEALLDTGGQWRTLEATVPVPAGCPAVQLQLRTQKASDAAAGLRGTAHFDDLRLSAIP